jgi:hypothetical protein
VFPRLQADLEILGAPPVLVRAIRKSVWGKGLHTENTRQDAVGRGFTSKQCDFFEQFRTNWHIFVLKFA